jgi:hypothetical protein
MTKINNPADIHEDDKVRIIFEGRARDITSERLYLQVEGQVDRPYMPLEYATSIEVISHGDPTKDAIGIVRGNRFIKLNEVGAGGLSTGSWWDMIGRGWAFNREVQQFPITSIIHIHEN